ncbi:MAG TPA: hypothetical protein VH134_17665, partial [Candidatus Dormibacteraeota bacterium]|nr:hypothetical protein [Candidatus Dormibacteraeota bacterium]
MSERQPRPTWRPQEFNELVNELGDLVETLGLEEGPRPARARRSRPPAARRTAPRPAATAPAAAVALPETEVEPAVPHAETPVAEVAVDAAILDDTTFWVAPAEVVEPGGRPWSPAAAMEFVPSAGAEAAPAIPARPHSGWVMTAAAGTAVGLALFALVVSHIDLASTSGPDHAVSAAPFTLKQFRTVAADSQGQVFSSQTTTQFPATTDHLFIDLEYAGATPHDHLQLKVIRDSTGLPPPAVVQDHTYSLDSPDGKGSIPVELTAPAGTTFARGRYTVSVVHGQTSAQTIDFSIGDSSGG